MVRQRGRAAGGEKTHSYGAQRAWGPPEALSIRRDGSQARISVYRSGVRAQRAGETHHRIRQIVARLGRARWRAQDATRDVAARLEWGAANHLYYRGAGHRQ